jgi:PEGA domain
VVQSKPPSELDESAIKSATFVLLNKAAKEQNAKQGGTLDSSKVKTLTLDSAFSFISSSYGFGQLHLDSIPSGAEIYIDDQYRAPTPENIGLSAGHHRYKVIAIGSQILCNEDILIERDKTYQKTCPPK